MQPRALQMSDRKQLSTLRQLVVVAVLGLLVNAGAAENTMVVYPKTSRGVRVALSLHARRNATGHWVLNVDATGDAGRNHELRMGVDAELRTARPGTSAVQLSSTAEWRVSMDRVRPPTGYQMYGGSSSAYKAYTEPTSWNAAEQKCLQEGAHLVVVDSEHEAAVVRGLISSNAPLIETAPPDFWHAGFHNGYNMNETITIFGDPLPAWALTHLAPPETVPDERCGRVKASGAYERGPCETKRAFLCEFEGNVW